MKLANAHWHFIQSIKRITGSSDHISRGFWCCCLIYISKCKRWNRFKLRSGTGVYYEPRKKTCTLHFFLVICSSKTLAVKHLVEKFSSLTWRYNYHKRVTGNKDLCTYAQKLLAANSNYKSRSPTNSHILSMLDKIYYESFYLFWITCQL